MNDGHEVLTVRSDAAADVAREIDFRLPRQRETHARRQIREWAGLPLRADELPVARVAGE